MGSTPSPQQQQQHEGLTHPAAVALEPGERRPGEKTAAAAAQAAQEAARDATLQAAQQAAKERAQQELTNSITRVLTDPQNLGMLTNAAQFAGDAILKLTVGTGGGLLDIFKITKKRRRKPTKRKKKNVKKKKGKTKTNRRKRKKSKKKRKGKR